MDANVAALKMKILEYMGEQLNHLQSEAGAFNVDGDYAIDCNEKANELLVNMAKMIDNPVDVSIPALKQSSL